MTINPIGPSHDLLITGATIVDGTGRRGYIADVSITGDRIVSIGESGVPATRVVDAGGLIVAPGFIDAHVHSEQLLFDARSHLVVEQGITTHIVGQDGFGFAPTTRATFDYMQATLRSLHGDAHSHSAGNVDAFLSKYDRRSPANVATLVPHGCVRMNVLGHAEPHPLDDDETQRMLDETRAGILAGAVGVSSGMDYVPSKYGSTAELEAFAAVAAELGVPYVTHVRYEIGLLEAIDEALTVGQRSGAAVHISHLLPDLSQGVSSSDLLALLDRAHDRGVDVSFDSYPYTYGCTTLLSLLPPWAISGTRDEIVDRLADPSQMDQLCGDVEPSLELWNRCVFGGNPAPPFADIVGHGIISTAERLGCHPAFLVAEVLVASDLEGLVLGRPDDDAEEDLRQLLGDDRHLFGSDGIYGHGVTHPRGTHGAPAFLRHAVGLGASSLEEAVAHMTSRTAQRFGLVDRGVIAEGAFADLVVFDQQQFLSADSTCVQGVHLVLCNGLPVVEHGAATAARPGAGLRLNTPRNVPVGHDEKWIRNE